MLALDQRGFALLFALLAGCTEHDQSSEAPLESADALVVAFETVPTFWEQRTVAEELVALGSPTVIPRIAQHLGTENRARRCNAGFVLAGLGDDRGLAAILGVLEDRSERPTERIRSNGSRDTEGQIRQDRYYAARMLGTLKRPEAVPALIGATRDSSVNMAAAIALGEIGDRRAIPALRAMVSEFPDERIWSGYGLAALGEPEGFEMLSELAAPDEGRHWGERRRAVEMLGQTRDSRALPTLLEALKDEHPNVRVSAAQALGTVGDPKALPALKESFNDLEVTPVNAPTTPANEARKAIEVIEASGR